MFKSFWLKVVGALSIVIAILGTLLKFKSAKLDKVEHEIKVRGKIDDIRETQTDEVENVLLDEKKQIEQNQKHGADITADDINSL